MFELLDNEEERKGALQECGSSQAEAALGTLLASVGELFAEAGSDLTAEQQRFSEIEARFVESRFHLAVLGQFKRGKSTFLNALLGENLLPSSVVPLTSVPTFISWAPHRTIRVFYADGRVEEFTAADGLEAGGILSHYVTEKKNPLNRLAVTSVEVGYPSPLLHNGVVLIDTPGIGSTFDHNTEATVKFIPQCDAAFFLFSVDPPVTHVELEFLKSVKARVVRLFFIMNKIDYLDSSEQAEAVLFLGKVLQEQFGTGADVPIFNVSSRQGLEARLTQNAGLWQNSGMANVEDHLVNFLVEQKNHTLNLALAKKAHDVVNDARMRLQLQQKALTLPLEHLEKRLEVFRQKLREAEQKKIAFKDLLVGDQKRTIGFIDEQSGVLFKSYNQQLCSEVDRLLDGSKNLGTVEKEARRYIGEVVPRVFNRELEKTALSMDEHVNEIINSYRQQLLDLVEIVRRTAADIFEISYVRSIGQDILELKHEPFWVTDGWRVNWSPLPELWFESLLPSKLRMQRLRRRLIEDIDAIISHNVGNLRWATVCNITDSFYAFGLELDEQMQRAIESTGGAITAAHIKRTAQSTGIEPEIERIAALIEALDQARSDLSAFEAALSYQGHLPDAH